MVFEKIWFNDDHWKGKTEAEFIAHESHHGLKVEQLKEVFKLMNPVKKVVAEKAATTVKA